MMLSALSAILWFCFALYTLVAILYTTDLIIVSPIRRIISISISCWISFESFSLSAWLSSSTGSKNMLSLLENPCLKNHSHIWWSSSHFALENGLGYSGRTLMNQSLFISKAFSNSLRPTKIIPYYYRASGVIEQDDITITTLITRNRFPVFSRLVEHYQGPISVTIHVKNDPQNIRNLLTALDDLYASSKFMSMYVDVHLVVDPFDRQFNLWRNVARFFARTDFVMMLDIDFAICTDFRSVIRADTSIMGKLREGNTAYVVPAFEYADHREGVDEAIFPKEKQVLLSLVHTNRVGMFHSSWAFGHGSTDYEKYYNASPGTIYKVVNYQSAYEPYVIFKKDGPPWCDERFIGYGGNKAACLFEMYLSGISYYVLADHFIIHQSHLYEEVARKNERKSNRRVYADFKEETCLRYLKGYHDQGILNTTKSLNAQQECEKIKGVKRIMEQLCRSPAVNP